jgi:hypothetical protein
MFPVFEPVKMVRALGFTATVISISKRLLYQNSAYINCLPTWAICQSSCLHNPNNPLSGSQVPCSSWPQLSTCPWFLLVSPLVLIDLVSFPFLVPSLTHLYSEDGGSVFLQSVGTHLKDYMWCYSPGCHNPDCIVHCCVLIFYVPHLCHC